MILSLTIFISNIVYSQTKNFIDQPYIETKSRVDTLVTPDRIFLSIFINEEDTKGKISVEEQENKMASTLKLLGSEGNLSSASNVRFAKVVRVLNNKTSVQVITKKNAGGTTLATVTLAAAEVAYIEKAPSDTLTGAATSLAVSVAYSN